MNAPLNLAIIGTGYVASMYAGTLANYPILRMVGAYDTNPKNLASFCHRWSTRPYSSIEEVLGDPSITMVLNLTDPRSHFEITRRSLEAGKHVYSEKPLGMNSDEASTLVALAEQRGLYIGTAPCSLLSDTAQTIWKALKSEVVGKIRLVYADFDDGMIAPNLSPWSWTNDCGVAWPAKDEFEVGCTFIHAGYVLTWLAAFFGPAKAVTAYSSCILPDKGIPVERMAPDFSVGCLEYEGVTARVTCGLVAPRNKSLTIIGDKGIICTDSVRNDAAPVYVQYLPAQGRVARLERTVNRFRGWLEASLPIAAWPRGEFHIRQKHPFARRSTGAVLDRGKPVDFNRGPAELAAAILERRPCRLSARLGLHIVEIIEALQFPQRFGGTRKIESTFDPIQPLPWNG